MFINHFFSLMKKNCIILRRNWTGLFCEIVVSILCILALVIFRKVEDKVLVPEKSYLNTDQKTLYPSLVILNSEEYYEILKNMSSKYGYSFPIENCKI